MPDHDSPTFYVTTPIYYVNDRPHIGHVYTTTVADVLARYHRLAGEDVMFLTGTDEHAAKVVGAAAERGLTAQAWADTNAEVFESTFRRLHFTHDDFIRTSQPRHTDKVKRYIQALQQTDAIYLGQYEGWYDEGEEEYVPEARAREHDYQSPISGRPLTKRSEDNYYFRLSAYRERVAQAIEDGTFRVAPESRKNEILKRLADAEDVPISRTGSGGWGIPMPGAEDHTVYVWIDALFNYLTTVDTDDRHRYWQSGAVHLIAKDILWFHAAIWPAVLMALAEHEDYQWVELPGMVYAHSFWIAEGQKMSKSLGNFIDLDKIDRYIHQIGGLGQPEGGEIDFGRGLDALRYFLTTQGPMGSTDADFAEAKYLDVYNSDLANGIGNAFSRVANMTAKYFEGVVPQPSTESNNGKSPLSAGAPSCDQYVGAINQLNLFDAVGEARHRVDLVDKFIEHEQPFKLAKDPANLDRVGAILYDCAEALRIASVLLWPVIPDACEKVWARMGLDYKAQMDASGGRGKLAEWVRWGGLQPGAKLEKGGPLFPRYQPPKA